MTGDDIAGGYWERQNGGPIPVGNNVSSLSDDKRTLKYVLSIQECIAA